jgi:hypothetical protein
MSSEVTTVVEVPFEVAKRRLRRIAALAGVAVTLLVSAVPVQAANTIGGHSGDHRGHKVA